MTSTARFSLAALVLFSICTGASGAPSLTELTGPQIKAAFAGKVISEGAHWSAYLLPDGRTKSIELGHPHRGRWKIVGNELCVRINESAAPECWTVLRKGKTYVLRAQGQDLYEVTPEPLSPKFPFD
ncbi:MAG: hypothetical protein JZU58_24340 [Curvibacter lanceolatus]|uniref:hypothetical protein n=1 Tax=Curvibacter lanceolatus TaxID=86182 RepID=UPI0004CEED06|nr:hypothetical protein [Curvibacter lanceolatus]MBV5295477.1 hypothetical protein [Curvibacter lanceolatus]